MPFGDPHLALIVTGALTETASPDDADLLEVLEPWRGQRARVVRLLQAARETAAAARPAAAASS